MASPLTPKSQQIELMHELIAWEKELATQILEWETALVSLEHWKQALVKREAQIDHRPHLPWWKPHLHDGLRIEVDSYGFALTHRIKQAQDHLDHVREQIANLL